MATLPEVLAKLAKAQAAVDAERKQVNAMLLAKKPPFNPLADPAGNLYIGIPP